MIRTVLRTLFNKLKSAKIIMLHHVQDQAPHYSPCIISTENLLAFLDKHSKYISVEDLQKGAKAYDDAICLTIDDSLYDLYTVAFPLLTERNIPFIAFVSSDLLDTEGYITSAQLKEMADHPLVTIGSHGATHRCLDTLSEQEQWYELSASKEKLEKITGKQINYYAYSNGRFDKHTKPLLKKACYKKAFGVRPRAYNILSGATRWELPRYNLTDETNDLL